LAQHIHIVGICGTFMGGLALLARAKGYRVTGSDANVYPPMSDQLAEAGIELMEGYGPGNIDPQPDLVVLGNALSRGNPEVEAILNAGLPYVSGPQWLGEEVLAGRWVLAVSGTHGKTTTSSMLAWILEDCGMAPGFLIGGVPGNFGQSARLGQSDFFVVEADEYDTAFFDKRSKFVHYRPRTLIIGNLEFDHADIFPDLAAIETQFHHLIRCIPGEGLVIRGNSEAIDRVLDRGLWTPSQSFGADPTPGDWCVRPLTSAADSFEVTGPNTEKVTVNWDLMGQHNMLNACAALAAAHHAGVPLARGAAALASFAGVKRRLELRGRPAGVLVYDDFAHHPTAIAMTLQAMGQRQSSGRLIAVIEPRSATMRSGQHSAELNSATRDADRVFWFQPPGLDWPLERIVGQSPVPASAWRDLDDMIEAIAAWARPGDAVVIMSNGGFGGIHEKLIARLQGAATPV